VGNKGDPEVRDFEASVQDVENGSRTQDMWREGPKGNGTKKTRPRVGNGEVRMRKRWRRWNLKREKKNLAFELQKKTFCGGTLHVNP